MFRFSIQKKIQYWEHNNNISKLINALKSERYYSRVQTIEALGRLNTQSSIPYLIPLMEDSVPIVRQTAANTLKKLSNSIELQDTIANKEAQWLEILNNKKPTADEDDYSFDKENYQWKGRFKRNMVWTNIIKGKLKKSMRWG